MSTFYIFSHIERIFILGAGASVDYGLPVWSELGVRMKEKINKDNTNSYKHKKEISDWLEKIGGKGIYKTLDECIYKESASKIHHLDGVDVENELFAIIKEVFNDSYIEGGGGWIRRLNEKILYNSTPDLENSLVFVNYNYDHVLDDNFLNYEYLPIKYRRLNFKSRLEKLSNVSVKTLCPHGTLFPTYDKRPSHLEKSFNTIKTGDRELLDAVSCYESNPHKIHDPYGRSPRKIYILGLGGGLIINLDKISFGIPISEMHVTIKDQNLRDEIISFLSEKFKLSPSEIKVYDTCEDLIEKCF